MKPLLTGCTCGKLTVEWRKVDGVWRGTCNRPCGFSTRAATGDAGQLDDREAKRG